LAFFKTAVWPASRSVRRNRALPYLDLASTAEHAGLDGGQIHAAKFQKLAVPFMVCQQTIAGQRMMEAAQVARLGQDGQGVDRPDAGNGAQQLVIRPIALQFDGTVFDGIALPDETSPFGQHKAE
jgi:hypothetical protein